MLYPMAAMVLLIVVIGIIAVKVRFSSVKNGSVSVKYYRLMQGENVPEIITKTTRCLNNQFEIPVLFYVVCTLYLSLGIESFLALILAWLFVVFRYVHAYIHLTTNQVVHRMMAFWLAFIAVIALWVNLVVQQV